MVKNATEENKAEKRIRRPGFTEKETCEQRHERGEGESQVDRGYMPRQREQ